MCSDLAIATPEQRATAANSLEVARIQCKDNDLRVDALVLVVRNALEVHETRNVDAVLQRVEEEFLNSARPMDRWIRNVLRCSALAVRGQLTAAYSHALEAQRLGARFGISDSAITWQLQSSQLLAYNPKLHAFVGVEPAPEMAIQEGAPDETMGANLLALAFALKAQAEVEIGETDSATTLIFAAEELLDLTSPDHYMLAAAGRIARTFFALNVAPRRELLEPLRAARMASLIVGMIPGWSMGPASRYAALANHLAGHSQDAIVELLQCADFARDTEQYLWEFVSLEDILTIDDFLMSETKSAAMATDQRSAIVARRRTVGIRFT